MVLRATDDQRRRLLISANSNKIRMHVLAKGDISQKRSASFGREHEMHVERFPACAARRRAAKFNSFGVNDGVRVVACSRAVCTIGIGAP